MIDDKGDDPRGDYLVGHDIKCLRCRIHFASDCGQCCYAWRIKQGKGKEAERRQRCKNALQRCTRYIAVAAHQNRQRTDNYFFGRKAGNKRRCGTPVSKTKRGKEGSNKTAYTGQHTVFGIVYHIESGVKALQQPDDDAGNEDNSKGFV